MSDNTLNVTGIDNHEMRDLRIGTFGGVVSTQMGDVIVIFKINVRTIRPAGQSYHVSRLRIMAYASMIEVLAEAASNVLRHPRDTSYH